MKKIIFVLALGSCLLALSSRAQSIDTAYHYADAAKIAAFKAKFTDTVNVTHLAVTVTYDDLHSNASLYWKLLDNAGNVHMDGNAGIGGSSYTTYAAGSNLFPFTFIGALLGLHFL